MTQLVQRPFYRGHLFTQLVQYIDLSIKNTHMLTQLVRWSLTSLVRTQMFTQLLQKLNTDLLLGHTCSHSWCKTLTSLKRTYSKGMVLYSAVSSPLDRSKRFTLFLSWQTCSFRHQLLLEAFEPGINYAQRLFNHSRTTVYRQVLIYTAGENENAQTSKW